MMMFLFISVSYNGYFTFIHVSKDHFGFKSNFGGYVERWFVNSHCFHDLHLHKFHDRQTGPRCRSSLPRLI